MDSNHPRSWWADILIFSLFFLLFYGIYLGAYPAFTPDEGRYSEIAREMMAAHDYITPRLNGMVFFDKPILHYWLQIAAMKLFGVKEFAWRFFPMLFGLLGCLMTYVSGRYLFNRAAGILGALMLATAPLYFIGAHYANLDLETAVLIACSLQCFIAAVHREQRIQPSWLYAAYTFAGLAVLTKGLIGLVFPTMIVGIWIVLTGRWRLILKMRLISGLLLSLLIALPWYLYAEQLNPGFWHYFFVTQHLSRFLANSGFNNPIPFWFYAPVVIIGFLPWLMLTLPALKGAFNSHWRSTHPTQLFLVLGVISIFIFFSIPHSKIVTYILPIFPLLALLAGYYASACWNTLTPKMTWPIILNYTLIAVGIFYFVDRHATDVPVLFVPSLHYDGLLCLVTIALLILCRARIRLFLIICLLTNSLLLFGLNADARYFNNESAKQIAKTIRHVRQSGDALFHFHHFFQDLPLYLHETAPVVANWQDPAIARHDNWQRELWLGMQFAHRENNLIDDAAFWQVWHSKQRVFVVLNENYLQEFKQQAKQFYMIARHEEIYLVCNQNPYALPENPQPAEAKSHKRQYAENNEQSYGIW